MMTSLRMIFVLVLCIPWIYKNIFDEFELFAARLADSKAKIFIYLSSGLDPTCDLDLKALSMDWMLHRSAE